MALQGTIDSFPLPDVLRFLAGGGRSGALQVDGDRGTVRLWMDAGECTAAESAGVVVDDPVRATFDALRCSTGTFRFDEDQRPPVSAAAPRPVTVVLAEALALSAEWDAVEQVLPSPRHRVRAVDSPPDGRVVLDPVGWRIVSSLGGSADVGSVVARSGASDLDGARALVGLVRDGLLVVEPPGPQPAEFPEVVTPVPEALTSSVPPSGHSTTPAPDTGGTGTAGAAPAARPEPADPFRPDGASGPVDGARPEGEVFPIDDLVAAEVGSDPWAPIAVEPEPAPDRPTVESSIHVPGVDVGVPIDDDTSHLSSDVADAIAEVLGAGRTPAGRTYEGGDPAFR